MDLFYRQFEIDATRVKVDERSVDVSFSSETPAMRWYGNEILRHGPGNVDLSRLRKMGAVLLNHNPSIIVGPLRSPKIENKRGVATIVFDDDDDGNKAMQKVKSGSLRGVSVGYMINKAREVKSGEEFEGINGPALIATRWTPYEISLTPIPADPTVGVGRDATRSLEGVEIERSVSKTFLEEENGMDEKEVRDLVSGMLKEFGVGLTETITTTVRSLIDEGQKPTMRIETDVFQDLLGRAGAVSLECKSAVADMAMSGKTEREIVGAIMDAATKKAPDATDTGGGSGGDGTGTDGDGSSANGVEVRSFKNVDDDTLFAGIGNPAQMTMD